MEKTTFNIPSISCSNCANKIQKEIKSMAGIENIAADTKSESLEVEYNPAKTSPQEIRKAIASMGYDII